MSLLPRPWRFAVLLAGALSVGAVAPMARPRAIASPPGMVRVQGDYRNAEYGFALAAPRGVATFRAAAPAPNHGVLVVLGQTRRIAVSAAFDATDYGSTSALLTGRLPPAGGVRRGPGALGGRRAERASYTEGATAHMVVARHQGGPDQGVNYTADLTSDAAHLEADAAIFRRVLAGFRFIPRV